MKSLLYIFLFLTSVAAHPNPPELINPPPSIKYLFSLAISIFDNWDDISKVIVDSETYSACEELDKFRQQEQGEFIFCVGDFHEAIINPTGRVINDIGESKTDLDSSFHFSKNEKEQHQLTLSQGEKIGTYIIDSDLTLSKCKKTSTMDLSRIQCFLKQIKDNNSKIDKTPNVFKEIFEPFTSLAALFWPKERVKSRIQEI